MKKASADRMPLRVPARTMGAVFVVLLVCIALASCALAPEYPVFPSPTTKVLPASFQEVFETARSVLNDDPRLVVHTVDKDGRFLAWEKTSGFIFFRHRTILDIGVEPVGREQTKITMRLSAEDYEMGGFTRPAGWYPSSDVDTFLGEDIMDLIEKKATSAAR